MKTWQIHTSRGNCLDTTFGIKYQKYKFAEIWDFLNGACCDVFRKQRDRNTFLFAFR